MTERAGHGDESGEGMVLRSGNLRLRDKMGIVLEASRMPQGAVRVYSAAGGSDLSSGQAKELRDWLDDGAEGVWRHEGGGFAIELRHLADLSEN